MDSPAIVEIESTIAHCKTLNVEPMREYCKSNPLEQTSVKFKSKYIFIQENIYDTIVC